MGGRMSQFAEMVQRTRVALRESGIPRSSVAHALLAEDVSLNLEVACEAVEEIIYLTHALQGLQARRQREIAKLTAERDEARRELCEFCESGNGINSDEDARGIASERGWDCFKEDGK